MNEKIQKLLNLISETKSLDRDEKDLLRYLINIGKIRDLNIYIKIFEEEKQKLDQLNNITDPIEMLELIK